jgi:hypothetical protein
MINAVTVEDVAIDYDTYEDMIFNDASSNQVVVADYIYRANESTWAPYFTLGVEFSLASVFAISLARDAALASAMDQQANVQLIKARRLDSQTQTTKKLNTQRFIAERLS